MEITRAYGDEFLQAGATAVGLQSQQKAAYASYSPIEALSLIILNRRYTVFVNLPYFHCTILYFI